MAHFFIHRPVFAWVLAIVTMLFGLFGLTTLPISQYPEVSPPTVRISASYPGASAQAVENSVTTVIEDSLTGLDGLLYMTGSSGAGSSSITLVFDDSTDGDDAQVEVQNQLQRVLAQLPDQVQDDGVRVRQSTSSILMVGALVSDDNSFSALQLADMLEETVTGPVERTQGVGGINVFGSGYAMRIWLDPDRLVQYQLTPQDVTNAVSAQNSTVTAGFLGDQPNVEGQQFTAQITAQSQLTTVDEFRDILLKTGAEGAAVRLGDVARVEIGQEGYGRDSRFSGKNAAGFGVNLQTGANAVDTAARVRETLASLAPAFPEGVSIAYAYDTSPFVERSITKVQHTLLEAIALVFVVMFVFLQNWRATLIPTLAVPVVLLGTFGVLSALGYSINTLTMFAMVLAIGLLVDDAIVVVENVERVMEEDGLGPVEATEKSMGQITGALIGITTVLGVVFLPMAFFGGSTGVIYRQFSVTIITAMGLSLLVALILTPALCATLLRPRNHGGGPAPARWFNRNFDRFTRGYLNTNRRILRRPPAAMAALAGVVGVIAYLFMSLPSSFLPQEDQGSLMAQIRLPEGSTSVQTDAVLRKVEDYFLTQEPGVKSTFAALGFGFGGNSQNSAMIFVQLKDFAERADDPDLAAAAIVARANGALAADNRLGRVFVLQPPAIPGMGNSSGFSMYLLDQGANGQTALRQAARDLVANATEDGQVTNMRGAEDSARTALRIDIDAQKVQSFGLTLNDVNGMLGTIFSGRNVNDFEMGSELRPVIVQADAPFRMQPDDVFRWSARNSEGQMVPFPSFATLDWDTVPASLARYGGSSALEISGAPAEGVSSGQAMARMEELVAELPGGYGAAWTGLSYQERLSGNQAPFLYAISVLVVFLCLAALYESWTIPLAVMLAVPVGVIGALTAALLTGQSNDVYFKVGLLTTIGLAAKNAILIVEFAVDLQKQGMTLLDATVEAARQRLRPILMTSFAFILGVVPLATATGAGAGAQNAIGIGVLGGMISATILGIFFIPVLFVFVRRLFQRKSA
ncbi:multidrug efflux RND transporter permease subunit [Falsirhodobacter halotolerans]|uniref:multidrug efflux RND transporter permease subunit n=1 Tax=Falsirhodobacter halotolerans TaxID=1146892 RepID=UPI001FD39559|nr:multidrug efflux RND transporter permease subunit [Falsirhodobacter halotolerans]MCJ8139007.1 multidrug efflux RND transporter permease subunit [Falsirhodobacter halotolerans]